MVTKPRSELSEYYQGLLTVIDKHFPEKSELQKRIYVAAIVKHYKRELEAYELAKHIVESNQVTEPKI